MSVRMASIDLCEGCRQYYAECVCGTEYAPHKCAADGCAAILYYPDEGRACAEHTCQACGVVVDALAVFSQPYRDDAGRVWLDDTATACVDCYGAMIIQNEVYYGIVKYKRRG